MTSYFITGGAGFIGTALSKSLVSEGNRVTVYDNFLPQVHGSADAKLQELRAFGISVVKGDVVDGEKLRAAVRGANPDVIFHLAAETGTGQSYLEPAHYTKVNTTGTANLIEAIRKAGPPVLKVILSGTRAVYGEGGCVYQDGRPAAPAPRSAEDLERGDFQVKDIHGTILRPISSCALTCPPRPKSIYASSKLMQEHLLTQGFWGTETSVSILRLQNVYGPGQSTSNPYTGVLSIFANLMAQGQTPDIYEDGIITRDFVFIDDVVRAFIQAANVHQDQQTILDIGSGEGITIMKVAQQMMRQNGLNESTLRCGGQYRPGDIRHAVANIESSAKILGWRPQVKLVDGLSQINLSVSGDERS
ncbi:NAD-dependent epimerase/dehydratase family protein [Pseudophaeobacter sp.]|uniref:NAD-dependent epimerase/dehydratase family protein n=1 Tax=Pseudophaeobacter sp. TaxID=1971739 RepID=UPI0032987DED